MEYDPPILSDYKIISIAVSREEVAELIRKNTFVRPDKGPWNEEIEADMLASLIALRKAMEKYPIQHAVSFHGSIQRAELFKTHNDAFSKSFRKYGKLETFHVSGKTPTGTRARVIGEFARAERALITNARCLTEGVDVPGIDCVLFADPRRSAVDIVQAVGRALRPAPGKQFGYVIVPILHDADATADDIFKSPAFKEILTTLRALAANDDRIIEYFRGVSQGRQRKGGGSVQFDIDERLAKRIDLAEFAREIELKCWDRLAKLSWRPFEEARVFARSIKVSGNSEWRMFCKGELPEKGILPSDIPANPDRNYANEGWISWGDWLGTGTIATYQKQYRPFNTARAFARNLSLRNRTEWSDFCKGEFSEKSSLPFDIPASPGKTYAGRGWSGYGDWLGTGNVAPSRKEFISFENARAFARSLQLASQVEWRKFSKGLLPEKGMLPPDIPSAPWQVYKNSGWVNMGDWLGSNTIAPHMRDYAPFEEARRFARSLEIKGVAEWREFCKGNLAHKDKLPQGIPASPQKTYSGKGWISWGDWLGTGTIAPFYQQFSPFREARAYVRSLGLKSVNEWRRFCNGSLELGCNRPLGIPANPERTYRNKGWSGYGDWLGTGNVATSQRKFRTFLEARDFVRSLNLKNSSEWSKFCKGILPDKRVMPSDIPTAPAYVYENKGWAGLGDWLGTGTVATHLRSYLPFQRARAFAHSLGLRTRAEWMAFTKGEKHTMYTLPSNIPSKPDNTYANKGWISWSDWLSTGRPRLSKSPKRKS